jgi:hypothetical protein
LFRTNATTTGHGLFLLEMAPAETEKPTEKKSQRSLNDDDMLEALKTLQSRSEEIFGSGK